MCFTCFRSNCTRAMFSYISGQLRIVLTCCSCAMLQNFILVQVVQLMQDWLIVWRKLTALCLDTVNRIACFCSSEGVNPSVGAGLIYKTMGNRK